MMFFFITLIIFLAIIISIFSNSYFHDAFSPSILLTFPCVFLPKSTLINNNTYFQWQFSYYFIMYMEHNIVIVFNFIIKRPIVLHLLFSATRIDYTYAQLITRNFV